LLNLTFVSFVDLPVIGYIHQLLPIKQSQNNNAYFDLKVQTENRTVRTVCFSPEKHERFKRSFEASSPVKLSQFQLRPNRRTNEEEIIVNKRTKLDNPFEHEITFDITTKEVDYATTTTTVRDAKEVKPGTAITVLGRITFQGGTEQIDVRGKSLNKQETILTDESGSIRLVQGRHTY
jgi:hypothetical protein